LIGDTSDAITDKRIIHIGSKYNLPEMHLIKSVYLFDLCRYVQLSILCAEPVDKTWNLSSALENPDDTVVFVFVVVKESILSKIPPK